MVTLAGPGVAIATIMTGFVVKFIFPYGWDWDLSLMLGGVLSATDPVAVVALLKELGQFLGSSDGQALSLSRSLSTNRTVRSAIFFGA